MLRHFSCKPFSIFFLQYTLLPLSPKSTNWMCNRNLHLIFLFDLTQWKYYWQVTFFWREISTKFWKQPAFQQKNSELWKSCSKVFAKECFLLWLTKKKGCKDSLFLDTQILVMLAKKMFLPFQENSDHCWRHRERSEWKFKTKINLFIPIVFSRKTRFLSLSLSECEQLHFKVSEIVAGAVIFQ